MMKRTLVAAFFISLGACSVLQAVTFTVTTTADNGAILHQRLAHCAQQLLQ